MFEWSGDMRHNKFTKKKGLLVFKAFVISMLLSSCSNTGDIEYQPVSETLTNKQLGQNVTLAILDFPDKRPPIRKSIGSKRKKNLVGIFSGQYSGIKIPLRKLYSDQAITVDVTDALENQFKANGFNVIRYDGYSDSSSLSDEGLAIKGQINEFFIECAPAWRGVSPSVFATIDIDLMIVDTKHQRTIWTGKIENYQRMDPKQDRGLFTGANRIFLFLNTVYSNAIEKAWIDNGMLNALRNRQYSRPDVSIEAGRDDHFIAYNNGIVLDTKTGLEWMAGPDRNMTWDEARSWVESLNIDGGGWRMPTVNELTSLYKKDAETRNMTQLLKTTGWYVWSGETKDSSSAWYFFFNRGLKSLDRRDYSGRKRAFAVRSRGDG